MIFLKIIRFLPFLTQTGQKFGPKCPSNVAFLSIFALNFHSSICTTTTFSFKRYSPCEIWKKLIDNTCFFTFFTILGLIWPKFRPKTTLTLIYFAFFQWNMLRDSTDINNFNLNSSEIFLLKPLKITIFWPNFCKNGVPMGHAQNNFFFLSEITKPAHNLSKTFYFIKIYVLAELWMFFYFVWCFFAKKCYFQDSCVESESDPRSTLYFWIGTPGTFRNPELKRNCYFFKRKYYNWTESQKKNKQGRGFRIYLQLFKSFEFGKGSRMSDEKLVIVELKYLQNKIW